MSETRSSPLEGKDPLYRACCPFCGVTLVLERKFQAMIKVLRGCGHFKRVRRTQDGPVAEFEMKAVPDPNWLRPWRIRSK